MQLIETRDFIHISVASGEGIIFAAHEGNWRRVFIIHADGHKMNFVIIFLVFGLNMGQLHDTGRTPGGPKVYKDRLITQV